MGGIGKGREIPESGLTLGKDGDDIEAVAAELAFEW